MKVQLPYSLDTWPATKEALRSVCQDEAPVEKVLGRLGKAFATAFPETSYAMTEKSPYAGLVHFMSETAEDEELDKFLKVSLPAIIKLALEGESIVPEGGINYVFQLEAGAVVLGRKLVASLVALGFLCLIPHDEEMETEKDIPGLNFEGFHTALELESQQAKLRCILQYFYKLGELDLNIEGDVTFTRVVLKEDDMITQSKLVSCKKPLCPFIVRQEGLIEDAGAKVLQVDFANRFLGGGVLSTGRVQEEIRFCICPELLVGMLFQESMKANEAIIMQGFEQFAAYEGYADSLEYAGPYEDKSDRDSNGNILTALSAIDAISYFIGSTTQFLETNYVRDISKGYAGFSQPQYQPWPTGKNSELKALKLACQDDSWAFDLDPTFKRTIATGNWGCGAFRGDPQLKSLIQWIAASYADCPALVYYTFNNEDVVRMQDFVSAIQRKKWSVGDVTKMMVVYCDDRSRSKKDMKLYDEILKFGKCDVL